MLQKWLEISQVHNSLKKPLGRYLVFNFITLLQRYLLVSGVQAVLDSIFMYPQVTVDLTLLSHVYAYAVIERSKIYPNLIGQSDVYDQLPVVSGMGTGNVLSNMLGLLQKPFTHK